MMLLEGEGFTFEVAERIKFPVTSIVIVCMETRSYEQNSQNLLSYFIDL